MVLTESLKKLAPDDSAPDFDLQGIDGASHTLNELMGPEGTLIVFMCNHCPYVKAKMDDLVDLHNKFKGRVALIGINSNDPEYPGEGMDNMKEFAHARGIEFPYLLDDSQNVARAYGATCTPDPFLFDGAKKLIFHGKINDAMQPTDTATEQTVAEVIERHLTGEKIDPWFDPSIGCSIKFAE